MRMAFNKHKLTKVKIAVFGDGQVGKTAFAVRYLTKRFIGEYDSNTEKTYSHKALIDKDEITIDLLDTAKQEEEVLAENIKWADGFILMYSVTSRQSFKFIEDLHPIISKVSTDNKPHREVPLALVANKVDLLFSRMVTETEGCELATSLDCPIYELSVAENGQIVSEAVEEVIRQIKREFVKSREGSDKSMLTTVKRALKKKIYRSKSDTV